MGSHWPYMLNRARTFSRTSGSVILALDKDGPVIPAPGVVGGMVMEEDLAAVGPGFAQEDPDLLFHCRPGDVDVHLFVVGEVPHRAGKDRGHRPKLAGPGGFLVRPAEPGAAMRRPLGRHGVAELCGSGRHQSSMKRFVMSP